MTAEGSSLIAVLIFLLYAKLVMISRELRDIKRLLEDIKFAKEQP